MSPATDLLDKYQATNPLSVKTRSLALMGSEVWDHFATRAGASLRGSYRQLWAWRLRRLLTHRVRIYEFLVDEVGGRRKVAQCAVGLPRNSGHHQILDGVHLSPGDEGRWPQVMRAMLDALGDGEYEYGWVLSLEPRREALLRALDGVEVRSVQEIEVHAVDFSRWESWSGYYRAISENSKRSAKAALRDMPDLSTDIRFGWAALGQARDAGRMNHAMAQRKGLSSDLRRSQARYAFGVIFGGSAYTIALARAGTRVLSCYFGAEFGSQTYYLEGGSDDRNGGGSWHLLLIMLQRAFERHPKGHFVMGYADYSTHNDEVSGGLIRSRQACRVSRYETSIVRFRHCRKMTDGTLAGAAGTQA